MSYKELNIPKEVKAIHTEEELLRHFPNAKELYSKTSHAFWEVEFDLFIKIYYLHKNGKSMQEMFDKGMKSYKMEDVDYDKFNITSLYTKK